MNKFHTYLLHLRKKRFRDAAKLCKILGVDKNMWRKIERGINPPPRKSLLKKFCNIAHTFGYEETQLYELARRWEPHQDTNTVNHLLMHKNSTAEWRQAMLEQNTPDYEHKYWGKH